jgi:hypothetical protein
MVGKPVVTRRGNPSGCPVLSLGVSTGAGQDHKQDSGICGRFVDTKTREPHRYWGFVKLGSCRQTGNYEAQCPRVAANRPRQAPKGSLLLESASTRELLLLRV